MIGFDVVANAADLRAQICGVEVGDAARTGTARPIRCRFQNRRLFSGVLGELIMPPNVYSVLVTFGLTRYCGCELPCDHAGFRTVPQFCIQLRSS